VIIANILTLNFHISDKTCPDEYVVKKNSLIGVPSVILKGLYPDALNIDDPMLSFPVSAKMWGLLFKSEVFCCTYHASR